MSEETEGAGAEAPVVNPAASALALSGASREEADAFLREQTEVSRLLKIRIKTQDDHLHEEERLKLSHLRIRRFGDYAKMALEISIGLLVLALVAGISLMVWNAAHSDGLVIESFSVPPEMSAKGLTGQVIAGQVLDRVTVMNATRSNRAPQSYANNWGNDLKVEIPDTGVSIGEAYRFLKTWLGHETHVTGEVWRTDSGIAITARVTGGSGATVTGPDADFPALLQRAAESVFAQTQPYRYAVYLIRSERRDEALPRFKDLTLMGAPNDRGWAYLGWANVVLESATLSELERLLRQSLPYHVAGTTNNLSSTEHDLGREELALKYLKQAYDLARNGGDNQNPLFAAANRKAAEARLLAMSGAWHEAAASEKTAIGLGYTGVISPSYPLAEMQMGEHDLAGARLSVVTPLPAGTRFPVFFQLQRPRFGMDMAWALEDWAGVVSHAKTISAISAKTSGLPSRLPTTAYPQLAYAQAKLGQVAAAEALIAPAPGDCYPCLIQRARIADLRGQSARADFWFARAVAEGPSLPMAEYEWGRALLNRKKPDDAIEQFKLSNKKGPHFADPLEGWGEALMAKNQSHRALAKFTEAEKYAPNWGRLHLKWGQALAYSGNKSEAAKRFARAAQLDLTPSEKTELAKLNHG